MAGTRGNGWAVAGAAVLSIAASVHTRCRDIYISTYLRATYLHIYISEDSHVTHAWHVLLHYQVSHYQLARLHWYPQLLCHGSKHALHERWHIYMKISRSLFNAIYCSNDYWSMGPSEYQVNDINILNWSCLNHHHHIISSNQSVYLCPCWCYYLYLFYCIICWIRHFLLILESWIWIHDESTDDESIPEDILLKVHEGWGNEGSDVTGPVFRSNKCVPY